MDQRFQDIHTVLRELQQTWISADTDSVQMCNDCGEEGSVMEYKGTRVLPFDVVATSNAVWETVEGVEIPQKLQ